MLSSKSYSILGLQFNFPQNLVKIHSFTWPLVSIAENSLFLFLIESTSKPVSIKLVKTVRIFAFLISKGKNLYINFLRCNRF